MNIKNKFIKVIFENSVNFKVGDNILIASDIENSEFARDLAEYASYMKAKNVDIIWSDLKLKIDCHNNQRWKIERNKYYKDEHYKMIWLYNNSLEFKNDSSLSNFQEILPIIQTTVIDLPNQEWETFLIKEGEINEGELWDKILTACRMKENSDYVEHLKELENIKITLNNLRLRKLLFKTGSGTHMSMELIDEHIWKTCISNNNNTLRVSNIPTEEVFTTPKKYSLNGKVVVTKPIIYKGKKIDRISLEFKDGEIINYTAASNLDMLKEIIEENKNMKYVGEIGLVSIDSPISKLGINWYDTSFDENIASHIALGSSYANTVVNGFVKTIEEKENIGMNQAEMHIDLTIGDEKTTVTGITDKNEEIKIIENGIWNKNLLNI